MFREEKKKKKTPEIDVSVTIGWKQELQNYLAAMQQKQQ